MAVFLANGVATDTRAYTDFVYISADDINPDHPGYACSAWRPARGRLALAVAAMHLGIGPLMGLHHYECRLLVAGLAAWSARAPNPPADALR